MTHYPIWLPTARKQVARTAVGLAAMLGLLGQVITDFRPNPTYKPTSTTKEVP
jgi:hypothetical protein